MSRPLIEMASISIELTNACAVGCSNCTRCVSHYPKNYFITMEQFQAAIDSMVMFPGIIGMQGGEALLHPEFEQMCEYALSKLPKEKLGLWTCFPEGKEHYREVIERTFGNIFLNDHTRNDILHAPVLVASKEMPIPKWKRNIFCHHCWVQNTWSAAIIGKKAYFCEVAGALATLFNIDCGWKVEPEWWTRSPIDFKEQIESLCGLCGCALPLKKRASTEGIDDISPGNYARLEATSPKIKAGKYQIHDMQFVDDRRESATYKDQDYRKEIANKYGMFLSINERGYQTPHLKKEWRTSNE
jgi:hypothetical protein